MDTGVPWPSDIDKPTGEDKVDALINSFKNHLEIVTIDLDESDNPQTIFETLNFRGEPLRPSDLIRNFIFLTANQMKLPINTLYKTYWYEFDKPASNGNAGFWKQEESIGRNKIQHLDLFIYHYLSYITDKEILLTRTFQEFKNWWQKNTSSFEPELSKLIRFSRIFEKFYRPELPSRIGLFTRRLKILEYSTIYPLLLYVLGERDDLSSEQLLDWITILESYLIRRVVCNLTAKNYNNIFRVVLDTLKGLDRPDSKVLSTILINFDKESNRWPNDAEFENGWLSEDAYNRRGARVVLEAIDLQMMTSKQEELHIQTPLTIEHVMPKAWNTTNWPLPVLQEGKSLDAQVIYRNSILHTYGNLTLLTTTLNSSISNGPFSQKRPEIAKQSLLKMNSYFQSSCDSWTEEDIINRGKNLFQTAKMIWPYPAKD